MMYYRTTIASQYNNIFFFKIFGCKNLISVETKVDSICNVLHEGKSVDVYCHSM